MAAAARTIPALAALSRAIFSRASINTVILQPQAGVDILQRKCCALTINLSASSPRRFAPGFADR
jgi:hypothetical protein